MCLPLALFAAAGTCVAVCCSVLQCVAAGCSVYSEMKRFCSCVSTVGAMRYLKLPFFGTATHCNTLQHTATHCTHCNTLQHTATHCMRYHKLPFFGELQRQRVALDLHVLQCVAVCCSVLQCVAVCCSVLQCRKKAA